MENKRSEILRFRCFGYLGTNEGEEGFLPPALSLALLYFDQP